MANVRIPLCRSSKCRSRAPKVALLIETSNSYARGLLAGVRDYIRAHEPWNVHLSEHSRGERPARWLAGWDGDGVIARIESKPIARALGELTVPVVDLSAYRYLPEVPVVTTDNAAIAQQALEHFLERGFRHLAFCGDPQFSWSTRRCERFVSLVQSAGRGCAIYEPRDRSPTRCRPPGG